METNSKTHFGRSENFEIWYIHSAYKYVLTCKSWDANQFKHDCFTLTVMNFNLQNIASYWCAELMHMHQQWIQYVYIYGIDEKFVECCFAMPHKLRA